MAEHRQQEVCHHQRLAGAGRLCLRQAAAAEDPSLDQSVLQQEESGAAWLPRPPAPAPPAPCARQVSEILSARGRAWPHPHQQRGQRPGLRE